MVLPSVPSSRGKRDKKDITRRGYNIRSKKTNVIKGGTILSEIKKEEDVVYGAGIAFMSLDQVLLCERTDGQGWCFPGGKVEEGESFAQAAAREAREEAGLIVTKKLKYIGKVRSEAVVHGKLRKTMSDIFMCRDYDIRHDSLILNREILSFKYVPVKDVFNCGIPLFPPTALGLKLLQKAMGDGL